MKGKLKRWWSTIPQISTTNHISPQFIEHKKPGHDIWRWKPRTYLRTG